MSRDRRNSSARRGLHQTLSSHSRSRSPLIEQAIADDIAAYSEDGGGDYDDAINDDVSDDVGRGGPSTMYRRASGVAFGGTRPVINAQSLDEPAMTSEEIKYSRSAERSLLRDNHLLPPKHSRSNEGFIARLYRRMFGTKVPRRADDDHAPAVPAFAERSPQETSPLLDPERQRSAREDDTSFLEEQWEEAIASGRLRTTWQRETKTLTAYATPMIVTFFLQYSINVSSVLAVGHIGKMELGAVSLANMTAAVTFLAPFQGLATSLDTLCAQAYGSGHKHLVGLQLQRMTLFLFTLTPGVVLIWYFSEDVLLLLIPEARSAQLAGQYLKVLIFSIPGMILFETGKRFTQAQGLFRATTYVLILIAPLNVLLMWLLVWKLELGFIGAPISIAITENLLPIFLLFYVIFVDGKQCWGGFSKRALTNWWIMIRLALPGMIMVEAEWLAFEIMTFVSSRFGADYLAAQSVLMTVTTISYQIPWSTSIAASTRVANLIGANLVEAAKMTARVTVVSTTLIGLVCLVLYDTLRYQIPLLFTNDRDVIVLVAEALPYVAVMQIFDCVSSGAHGLLRGIGRQAIGGPANLFAFYAVSLPVSLVLAITFDMKLIGLWMGVAVGSLTCLSIEYLFIWRTDWHQAAREAESRTAAG